MRFFAIVLVVLGMSVAGLAQQSSGESEIHKLYVLDQAARGVTIYQQQAKSLVSTKSGSGVHLPQTDRERLERARELLAHGALITAEDFHDAAFIFQHSAASDDYPLSKAANDYLLAHVLATVAVQKGDGKSLWISAASLDRYLQAIGRPQIFGTQYISNATGPVTQAPYDPALVPDNLRAVFCVPSVEQQKANVKEFDAGTYPKGMIPPGCVR
jgi:hypothetical protein